MTRNKISNGPNSNNNKNRHSIHLNLVILSHKLVQVKYHFNIENIRAVIIILWNKINKTLLNNSSNNNSNTHLHRTIYNLQFHLLQIIHNFLIHLHLIASLTHLIVSKYLVLHKIKHSKRVIKIHLHKTQMIIHWVQIQDRHFLILVINLGM